MEGTVKVENPPDWLTWDLRTKYLPADFHKAKSMTFLGKLAKLNWKEMGLETALLVILAMGLALRDIHAIHFVEDGQPDPEDMPTWVGGSPLKVEQIHKVMETWGNQLGPVEYEEEDREEGGSKRKTRSAKGEGKAKGKGKEIDNDEGDGSGEEGPP